MAKRTCKIEGCQRPAASRGWCKSHHQRFLRHGDPQADKPLRPSPGTRAGCFIEGCGRPHKAHGLCKKHYNDSWWDRNPAGGYLARRAHHLAKTYGITADEYLHMVAEQDGRCAICGERPAGRARGDRWLHVDHCHTTGRVRGLLCFGCNNLLGRIERFGLDRISEYLAAD